MRPILDAVVYSLQIQNNCWHALFVFIKKARKQQGSFANETNAELSCVSLSVNSLRIKVASKLEYKWSAGKHHLYLEKRLKKQGSFANETDVESGCISLRIQVISGQALFICRKELY